MPRESPPLVLINAVGLTSRWLSSATRLSTLARIGWSRTLREVVPAVTCTAQAAMLTGVDTQFHGIVGNGWFWRETGEVRFWLQSNHLLQATPIYARLRAQAKSQGRGFR